MNALPSQTLRELIVRYGRSLYDDPRRLEALLRDFCGTHRQEISVLTSAARERIPPDLLTSISTVPVEVAIAQQTKRLQANLGLAEASARWSVESWAFALGLISETDITTPEQPTFANQPPLVPIPYQRETITPPQPPILQLQLPRPIQSVTPSPKNSTVEYAEFWQRAVAILMDSIIVNLGAFTIGAAIGIIYVMATGSDSGIHSLEGFLNFVGIAIGWLYFAGMESSTQQATIGKRIMKIQVTDLNGQRVSFGRATARHFGKLISAFILLIGFLMPLFDLKKQALHDKISGCLMVKK